MAFEKPHCSMDFITGLENKYAGRPRLLADYYPTPGDAQCSRKLPRRRENPSVNVNLSSENEEI